MSITSYAQNFEDVMLWRTLGHVPNGFYIDVGAQHPIVDSVSKAFYEHGWRGVHIEATAAYAALIRSDRPDELVLQVALSDKQGSLTLYEIPNTGLSTGDASIAEHHRSRNYNVVETVVPCITLAEVLTQVGPRDIHWLKIDVEGMEALVLAGWADHPTRPWVLVVESTYPNSQIETHQAWEGMLLDRGYTIAYFDGLSRYYLHADRTDLSQKFATPPNIFDGFSLAPSVPYNGPVRELIQQNERRHHDELAEKVNQLQTTRDALTERDEALDSQIAQLQNQVNTASEQKAAALIERNNEVNQFIEELHRQHGSELQSAVAKEIELKTYVQELQIHTVQEKLQLANEHAAKYHALQAEHAEREKMITLQLQASQEERLRQHQEQLGREQSLLEQTNQAKQDVQSALRAQLQREEANTKKLEDVHARAALESVELARTHAAQQAELHSRHHNREQALQSQAHNAQQEVEKLLRAQAQREQAFAEKLDAVRAQVWQDNKEVVRSLTDQQTSFHNQHIAHEQALDQHRKANEEQRTQLLHNYNQRELLLQEKNQLARQEIENLLRAQLLREQDISEQLATQQLQAAHDKSDLLHTHAEKLRDLNRYSAKHQEALTQNLELHQQKLHELRAAYQALENKAATERAVLAQQHREQMHALHSQQSESDIAHQLRLAQYDQELSSALKQHNQLLEVYAATELNLKTELKSGQQNIEHLKLLLAEAAQQIETTQSSLSWQMTAPLRKLAGLYIPNRNQLRHHLGSSEPISPKSDIQIDIKLQPLTDKPAIRASTMQPPVQPPPLNMSTIALSVSELLAHNDQPFVDCSYRTLLGRAPDAEGMRYYTSRLRIGFTKISILAQLYLSAEGKAHATKLTGLDEAIRRHIREQQPLTGWLFRLFSSTEGNSQIERKLRGIEYRLDVLNDENKRRSNQIDTIFLELQQSINILTRSGITPNQCDAKSTQSTITKENDKPIQIIDSNNLIDKFVNRIYEEVGKSNVTGQ